MSDLNVAYIFFKQKTAYEMRISDWSSDVCSSDLLAHAYPDRIAHQHSGDPRRYQLANGRSARLFDDSAVFGEPWLVIVELRHEGKDALILRAAAVDEEIGRASCRDRVCQYV